MALNDSALAEPSVAPGSLNLPCLSARTRLLVVAPHPDDETLGAGVLMQQVRAAGGEVAVVLLTDGDNNPWPQRWLERRLVIRRSERQRWGRRRHAEMLEALHRLGVPKQALHAMGWSDLGVTEALMQLQGRPLSDLRAAISAFQPNLLAIPALADRHPDHSAAHMLVRLALAAEPQPPRCLTYLVHGRLSAEYPLVINGSDRQRDTKLAAMRAHQSQMALSGERMLRLADRTEQFGDVAGSSTLSEALPWRPVALLRPWLRLTVLSGSEVRSWRWTKAPLIRDKDGAYRLSSECVTGKGPRFVRLSLTLPTPWIFDHWGWCEH